MESEGAEQPQVRGKPVPPGAQLKAQRVAMGWSVAQVAEQLKLAPRQVVALEEGDAAALPNMAVVRGFVRAYAKVVKLDAAPLVAMVEVNPAVSASTAPPRREIPATFSQVRFSSLTQRSSLSKAWIVAGVLVLAAAAAGAYKMGLISPALLMRADKAASAPATGSGAAPGVAPLETTSAKPGPEMAPLQSPSVPLISVPMPASGAPAASEAAPIAPAIPATPSAPAAAVADAGVPVAGNVLVLKVSETSWIELRRVGAAPLISRVVQAGSTESFKVSEPMLLIVGKPSGVAATLRGVPLALPPGPGGKPTRVNIQ